MYSGSVPTKYHHPHHHHHRCATASVRPRRSVEGDIECSDPFFLIDDVSGRCKRARSPPKREELTQKQVPSSRLQLAMVQADLGCKKNRFRQKSIIFVVIIVAINIQHEYNYSRFVLYHTEKIFSFNNNYDNN